KVGEFYTAKISDLPYYVIKDGSLCPFGYVAKSTGVCITIPAGEQLQITGMSAEAIKIPANVTEIGLYNVRPGDLKFLPMSLTLANQNPQEQKQSANTDSRLAMLAAPTPDIDEVQIFYDDLFELGGRPRTYFIPALPGLDKTKSLPFVCYGGGGSVN